MQFTQELCQMKILMMLFDLINFIVRKAITEPKELDELYLKTPESARKSAEMQDEKNRDKSENRNVVKD